MVGLELPKRVFPCASPAEVRATLPEGKDVLAFQCRNPIHKAHYELFIRALEAENVGEGAVCLVHPTCGPTQVCTAPCCSASGGVALGVPSTGLLYHLAALCGRNCPQHGGMNRMWALLSREWGSKVLRMKQHSIDRQQGHT